VAARPNAWRLACVERRRHAPNLSANAKIARATSCACQERRMARIDLHEFAAHAVLRRPAHRGCGHQAVAPSGDP
jgi:hypothetical protein